MNDENLRCLTETAGEMLNCYAERSPRVSTVWYMQGVTFYGGGNSWEIVIKGQVCPVTESMACRIIFAMTCNADLDIIAEALEDFRGRD